MTPPAVRKARDYHATGSKLPVGNYQDWSIHYGEQADGKTMIVASRAFTTGDSNDRTPLACASNPCCSPTAAAMRWRLPSLASKRPQEEDVH